jgi:hypothetical protein
LILLVLLSIAAPPPGSGQDTQPVKVLIAGLQGPIALASAWLEIDPLTDPRTRFLLDSR